MTTKKYTEAIEKYTEAIALDARNPVYYSVNISAPSFLLFFLETAPFCKWGTYLG